MRTAPSSATGHDREPTRIVLLAGRVKVPDRVGHHDYLGGCALLAFLLEQTPRVRAIVVPNGWPDDARVFEGARALVLYSGGGRKLPVLESSPRVDALQQLIDQQVGLVVIHQAVSYPAELAGRAAGWMGGAHVAGASTRGHWPTQHRTFPAHPVTRGVAPFALTDGWLTSIRFADGMQGITPVLWSGPTHRGSDGGGSADVAAWAHDRPGGGRSFCFTGLDAHSAWLVPGVRQLLVNGTLWSAGLPIPDGGAPCNIDPLRVRRFLTPRGSRAGWLLSVLRKNGRRMLRRTARR